jgi:hypothetical protein
MSSDVVTNPEYEEEAGSELPDGVWVSVRRVAMKMK